MDALLVAFAEVLKTLFSDQRNIALLISVSANVAFAWAHVVWRREERVDRQAMLTTFSELTKALTEVRIALAALVAGRQS